MAYSASNQPVEEPLAALERQIIDEFLRAAGHDPALLRRSSDAQARALLSAAARYASGRLCEVESRMHYLRSLRGKE
jgi:hypothetical protein